MAQDKILLGHGGGGRLTRELLDAVLLPPLRNQILDQLDDSAVIEIEDTRLAFTTDSYVIDPLEFPGGDVGRLAVCGTVNDLAMQGAVPAFLSLALIVEEGLPVAKLQHYIQSAAAAAKEAGVQFATGDTKVVERGHGSGLYINTAGIGKILPGVNVSATNAQPGDKIIVTGNLGDHGIAVMSCREGLDFESQVISDAAPLNKMVQNCLAGTPNVHVLRDPTRGGLTAAICDIASKSNVGARIYEQTVPVQAQVKAACELLGLDVLNVANEGKAVIICPAADLSAVLTRLQAHELGRDAVVVGEITNDHPGTVVLETAIGGERILTPSSGEDLPRIC